MSKKALLLAALVSVSPLSLQSPANAAAFYIQEQSVSGLGNAFSSAVSDPQDASTIYYNPAGMTKLSGRQVYAGSNFLILNADFKDRGSNVGGAPFPGPFTNFGNDGGNPFDPAMVPNFYAAMPLPHNSDLWIGLGITAPFGLTNKYDDNFIGRFDSTQNELMTLNISPTMAYKVNDWLSVGGGVDIQYADAKLENALPDAATPNTRATDGLNDLSGDDVSVGLNVGVMVDPTPSTTIGAHYRSGVSHTLEGRIITEFPDNVGGPLAARAGTTLRQGGATAELDLPDIASVGITQSIGSQFKVHGRVMWYGWANFDDIPVNAPVFGFSSTTNRYTNTLGYSIGIDYMPRADLTFKAGYQYDESPTRDGFRSTRIPDGDRKWITAGASYEYSERITIDLSAAYVDVDKTSIYLEETAITGPSYTVDATSEGDVGIVALGLKYKF